MVTSHVRHSTGLGGTKQVCQYNRHCQNQFKNFNPICWQVVQVSEKVSKSTSFYLHLSFFYTQWKLRFVYLYFYYGLHLDIVHLFDSFGIRIYPCIPTHLKMHTIDWLCCHITVTACGIHQEKLIHEKFCAHLNSFLWRYLYQRKLEVSIANAIAQGEWGPAK